MKKLFLVTALFLFLAVFIKTIVPKNTFAQSCTCLPYLGQCQSVTLNNCGTGQRPSCIPGNLAGFCAPTSCECIGATQTCSINPDSCEAADPNTHCVSDSAGFSCKRKTSTSPNPYNINSPSTSYPTNTNKILDKVFCDSAGKATTDTATGKIFTAIGCIPVSNTSGFIAWILGWAIGVGGGISLMLIIVASFQIISSSGNPEKVQAGKELLTSAIAGLIMLIFSVFILKVIGIDILKLPGIN